MRRLRLCAERPAQGGLRPHPHHLLLASRSKERGGSDRGRALRKQRLRDPHLPAHRPRVLDPHDAARCGDPGSPRVRLRRQSQRHPARGQDRNERSPAGLHVRPAQSPEDLAGLRRCHDDLHLQQHRKHRLRDRRQRTIDHLRLRAEQRSAARSHDARLRHVQLRRGRPPGHRTQPSHRVQPVQPTRQHHARRPGNRVRLRRRGIAGPEARSHRDGRLPGRALRAKNRSKHPQRPLRHGGRPPGRPDHAPPDHANHAIDQPRDPLSAAGCAGQRHPDHPRSVRLDRPRVDEVLDVRVG